MKLFLFYNLIFFENYLSFLNIYLTNESGLSFKHYAVDSAWLIVYSIDLILFYWLKRDENFEQLVNCKINNLKYFAISLLQIKGTNKARNKVFIVVSVSDYI